MDLLRKEERERKKERREKNTRHNKINRRWKNDIIHNNIIEENLDGRTDGRTDDQPINHTFIV